MITIDLQGPEGNAFVLLSYADKYGKELGFTKEKIQQIRDEMTLSDYFNLIEVFEKYFGDVIELVNKNF